MTIPVEAFAVTITGTPSGVHAWTEELFEAAMDGASRIWATATQSAISFDVGDRFRLVELAAADFPGGSNWETEPLTGLGREHYSMLTEQGLFFAVAWVNRNHPRASPFHVRLHLLPTTSRSVLWAGRGLADRVECYCPRPREDALGDILIAHELGHVLLGPGHEPRAENLMFMEELEIQRPPRLTDDQRRLATSSAVFTHWYQAPLSRAHPSAGSRDLRAQSRPDPASAVGPEGRRQPEPVLGGGSSLGPLGMPRARG